MLGFAVRLDPKVFSKIMFRDDEKRRDRQVIGLVRRLAEIEVPSLSVLFSRMGVEAVLLIFKDNPGKPARLMTAIPGACPFFDRCAAKPGAALHIFKPGIRHAPGILRRPRDSQFVRNRMSAFPETVKANQAIVNDGFALAVTIGERDAELPKNGRKFFKI